MFENRELKSLCIVSDLIRIMKCYKIYENIPKSKKHLDYNKLNLKSIRILNRLSKYLVDNDTNFNDFFKDLYINL
jgi:hypothetical protein